MSKVVLLTGGTDGIGYETAKSLLLLGHTVLLHGRNADKLEQAAQRLSEADFRGTVRTFRADLSRVSDVDQLANQVAEDYQTLDVLINNAGVFKSPVTVTAEGYDIRLIVNMVAPYVLTRALLPMLAKDARVVNLSSAAQQAVDLISFTNKAPLADSDAYAQSKLGLTMWSFHLAQSLGDNGPSIIAVNPGSFLGSKMVKEAYGADGHDLAIGADILTRAALSDEFAQASGRYFDNDRQKFASPHPDALNQSKCEQLVQRIEHVIEDLRG
ncbi:MAG: SDR family NAD(P)-dependent oxidoreductase [Alphaproteobacteria bacterium]